MMKFRHHFAVVILAVATLSLNRQTSASITSYSKKANAEAVVKSTQRAGGIASMNYDPKTKRWLVYQNFSKRRPTSTSKSLQNRVVQNRTFTTYYTAKAEAESAVRRVRATGTRVALKYDRTRRKWAVTRYYPQVVSTISAKSGATRIAPVSATGRTYTTYYGIKSNAEHFARSIENSGGRATMYFDANQRKWAVMEYYSSGSPTTYTSTQKTPTSITKTTTTVRSSESRKYTTYYSLRSNAEQMMRQVKRAGGQASLKYDTSRRKWAVTESYPAKKS